MRFPPLDLLALAASDPSVGIAEAARLGLPVIRTLGVDAPVELIVAAGAVPVRVAGDPSQDTPNADRIMGEASVGPRGRRLLEQLLGIDDPVVITQADAAQPQLFAALRELGRLGETVPEHVHFLDLLHLPRASSRKYNEKRIARFIE